MRNKLNYKFTFNTVLTGFVLLSVTLTVSILLIASYQSEKKLLTETYLTLNDSKSNKLAKSVDSLFQSMRESLVITTSFLSENIDDMSDEAIQAQFELLRNSSKYFNSLTWIDETGIIRSLAPVNVGLKGETITGVTKEVLDSKKPTVTNPYIAPSGRLLVLLSEPLYDGQGVYRGIVGGTIYLQEKNVLNEILGNDVVDENGSYYYVVGPEGRLLFHPDVNRVGEEVTANPIVRKVMQGQSGMDEVTNTKGVAMFASYNYVPEIGWGVVQQTPVSFIDELLYKHTTQLFYYIFPPLLVILLFSIFISHKLTKPFHNLAELMNQLSSKEEIKVPKVHSRSHWNREVNLLTKSVLIALESVEENNKKLTNEALTDSLTKIPNRRNLNQVIDEWANQKKAFSLVVFDVDFFKSVNDIYGHIAGDEVLRDISNTVSSLIRQEDMLFRYGGEEFVILLPNTTFNEAYEIAEKVRITFANRVSPIGKKITLSFGVSEFPLHTDKAEDLFIYADKSLYQSKLKGRNQTTIWSEDFFTDDKM